jgi:hypothetical protein
MNNPNEAAVGKLVMGATFILMALIALYKAGQAILEHTPIVFKFALVSPAQACIAGALSLFVGLYFVIAWWRERRSK